MNLLYILGLRKKEPERDFEKYVNDLSSEDARKLYETLDQRLRLEELRERLDETRRRNNFSNAMRHAYRQ